MFLFSPKGVTMPPPASRRPRCSSGIAKQSWRGSACPSKPSRCVSCSIFAFPSCCSFGLLYITPTTQALCAYVEELRPSDETEADLFQAVFSLVSAGVFLPHGIAIPVPWRSLPTCVRMGLHRIHPRYGTGQTSCTGVMCGTHQSGCVFVI